MDEDDSDSKTFFICDICNKIFKNRQNLNIHNTQNHSLKTFKCAVCETYFDTHEKLLEHMSIHCSAFSFKCQNCGKSFTSFTDLKMHMEDHIHDKNMTCFLCNQKFGTLDVFQLHMEKIHKITNSFPKIISENENNIEKQFKCDYCSEQFVSELDLSLHLKTHKPNGKKLDIKDPSQSNSCVEGVIRQENNLSFTISKVSSISARRSTNYPIPKLLDKDTSKILEKSQNLISEIKEENETFNCRLCNDTFAFEENLELHLKTHPKIVTKPKVEDSPEYIDEEFLCALKNENGAYSCNLCNNTFAFEENLELHLLTHSDAGPSSSSKPLDPNTMIQCDICGEFTYDQTEFYSHKQSHIVKCDPCNEIFVNQMQLDKHLKSRPDSGFICKVCEGKFEQHESLALHYKIRHEKKNFMCGVCGEVFSKNELKRHMKRHSKRKVLMEKCDICDEMVEKTKLPSHIESHDMSEFFYCEVCDDEFDDAEQFQDHFDNHFICRYCSKVFNLKEELDSHIVSHYHTCDICELKFETLNKLREHEKDHDKQSVETFMEDMSEEERQKSKDVQPEEVHTVPEISSFSLPKSQDTKDQPTPFPLESIKSEPYVDELTGNEVTSIQNEAVSDEHRINGDEPEHKKSKVEGNGSFSKFRKNIKCEFCTRRYRSMVAYRDHLKKHSNKCKDCGKIFRKVGEFRDHVRTHKNGSDSDEYEGDYFTCIDCGESIIGKREFQAHQSLHKDGNRRLECNICGEQFLLHQIRELEQHGERHRGERINGQKQIPEYQVYDLAGRSEGYVKCYICQKTFMNKTVLIYHMNTIHYQVNNTPKIKYRCDVCFILFPTRTELSKHRRQHFESEPSFDCMYKLCHQTFPNKEELREHVKTHFAIN